MPKIAVVYDVGFDGKYCGKDGASEKDWCKYYYSDYPPDDIIEECSFFKKKLPEGERCQACLDAEKLAERLERFDGDYHDVDKFYETEQIVCACIKIDNEYYKGRDHAECYKKANKSAMGFCEQGFWTTHDRFVDRQEAGKIGFEAGQLAENPNGKAVYSEDFFSDQVHPLCYWDTETGSYKLRG